MSTPSVDSSGQLTPVRDGTVVSSMGDDIRHLVTKPCVVLLLFDSGWIPRHQFDKKKKQLDELPSRVRYTENVEGKRSLSTAGILRPIR